MDLVWLEFCISRAKAASERAVRDFFQSPDLGGACSSWVGVACGDPTLILTRLFKENVAEKKGILAEKLASSADESCLWHAARRHHLSKATLQ